jgi:uncharacterized delta-60 repeat protein
MGMPRTESSKARSGRGRTLAAAQPLESRLLFSTFSDADLNGTLTYAGMSIAGSVVADGAGNFTSSQLTNDSGTTSTSGATYTVNSDGTLSLVVNPTLTGALNSSKNVGAVSGTNLNSLGVLISSGSTTFSDADLTGNWDFFNNGAPSSASGQVQGSGVVNGNSGHGVFTFDGNGNLTYTHSDDSTGNTDSGTGTYSVSPTGVVNVNVNASSGAVNFTGAMNSSKDVVAASATNLPAAAASNDSRLTIMVKPSGTYSTADLVGTWTIVSDAEQGTVTFDGAGNITGTLNEFQTSLGPQAAVINGTYTIAPDGSVTAIATTAGSLSTSTLDLSGYLNASRNVLAADQPTGGQNAMDDLGLFINSSTPRGDTVSLSTSAATIAPGVPVTLNAVVTPTQANNVTPTGTVNFLDGSTLLGSANLQASGIASFTTSALATGTHSITAVYTGDTAFVAGTSSVANVVVTAPATIGGLDPGFGNNGQASHNTGFASTRGVAVAGPQSILIGTVGTAPNQSFGLTRYNADGSLDTTFGSGGVVNTSFANTDDVPTALDVLPTGQILVAGTATTYTNGVSSGSEFAIAEYNSDGSLDTAFGAGSGEVLLSFSNAAGTFSNDILKTMIVSPAGVIYLGGRSDASGNSGTDFALAALNPDGTLQSSFGSGGKVLLDFAGGDDSLNSLALQPSGEIIAAGSATIAGVTQIALAGFLANGTLDPQFGSKGTVTTNVRGVYDSASSVVIQPNGAILVGGLSGVGSGSSLSSDFVLARYTANGRIDRSFAGGTVITTFGQPSAITQLALLASGGIVASGKTTPSLTDSTPGDLDLAIARYTSNGVLDTTFNGTGKTIISLATAAPSSSSAPPVQLTGGPDLGDSLASIFDQFINSSQGVVAITSGGEILDAGTSGTNTVEAELVVAGVDLTASLLSQPPTAITGGTKETVSVQVAESGTSLASGTVTIELEIAADPQGDGATALKIVPEKINLRQQQSRTYRIAFVYPQSVTAGNYYLVADVQNGTSPALKDLNAANNVSPSKSAVDIAPPLISLQGSNLTVASPVTAGKIAQAIFTVTNNGNITAKGVATVDLILSTDQTTADATMTAVSKLSAGLAAGKSRVYRVALKLPTTLAPGPCYLIAVIDPLDTLGAMDHSSSKVLAQIVVGAAHSHSKPPNTSR